MVYGETFSGLIVEKMVGHNHISSVAFCEIIKLWEVETGEFVKEIIVLKKRKIICF